MRLLLVEHDPDLAAFLSRGLSTRGHDVHVAREARDAIFMISDEPYDALIVERHIPHFDGLALLRKIRGDGRSVPVVMLSDANDLLEKVEGLDAGADDYIVKPVAMLELNARLNAIARRPATFTDSGKLRAGNIEVDLLERKVARGGHAIDLATLEFKILVMLLQNVDKVVSRPALLKQVWGYDREPATNIVASQIARIRTKLNVGGYANAIRTVHGSGYVIYNDM